MHLGLLLDMAADAMPDRIAVGTRDGGLTFAALRERARAAAAWLGGTDAERVALVATNSPAVPLALFGAALAGRPFVPVNYRLDDERLGELLARTAPAVAIVDPEVRGRVDPEGVELVEQPDFLGHLTAAADAPEPLPGDPDDVAALLFTSGTTAAPKAAVLRHANLAAYVISTVEFMGAGEEEAALVGVPPYHVASIAAILTNLYAGRRLVYLDAFDEASWVATAREEAITHAMVVPTMLGRILDVLERDGGGLPALRALSYGGGPMPRSVVERALALLPDVGFVNAYGLTETSSTIALLGPEDHRVAAASDDPDVRRRLGSVGRPLPGLEVVIADPEGAPLPAGEWGEVLVRGEQVSGEYQGGTAPPGGWFATRDRGMLDEGGYLFLGGRLDDVIVRGGENLSPAEIEEVLLAHPACAAAAVVAAPSEEWGEEPVAFVVPAGPAVDPEELRAWVRSHLRSAWTPAAVILRDELPFSETGKLLRRVLRGEAEKLRSAR